MPIRSAPLASNKTVKYLNGTGHKSLVQVLQPAISCDALFQLLLCSYSLSIMNSTKKQGKRKDLHDKARMMSAVPKRNRVLDDEDDDKDLNNNGDVSDGDAIAMMAMAMAMDGDGDGWRWRRMAMATAMATAMMMMKMLTMTMMWMM